MATLKFKASALSAGIAMALGTSPAAVAQDDSIEEIVVTGSHIRTSEFDSRAPIQVVDAQSIALIGATQPVEMLKELTVNSGSQFYNETNNRAGVAQFNIRNLGLGSTLTLINGRRAGIAPVADDSGTDFFDINQLPLAMIERVEVLTDGASAIYGSQAVAGVANIITRKGFEGFEISGGYSTSEIDTYSLSMAAGSQFEKGGFNVYATYREQDFQDRSDFDWMVDRLIGQGDITRSRFLSSTGSPGSFRRATIDPGTGEATQVAGAISNPDPDCVAAGGVITDPADTGAGSDVCRYHFVDQVSVISAERRAQVFAEFDWEFNDSVKYYNEVSFSNNLIERNSGGSTLNTGTATGGGFTIPGDHPFNFFIEDPADPAALTYIGPQNWDPAIHTGAALKAVARPLGADVNHNELTQKIHREISYTRIMQGFEWTLPGDWFLDTSYGWAKSVITTDSPHNYRSELFQDQVKDGDWNPFGTRLADPTLISPKDGITAAGSSLALQNLWDERSASTSRAVEQVVDAIASGELFDIGSNTVGAAIGAQYRRTVFDSVGDSLSNAGLANEEGISATIHGTQEVVAVFAEVVVPIGDIAEIQLALRNEDYGDGVSTTDPKLSFKFSPTDWLGVRGSFGTSFQAPTVRQTASAASSAFIDDPASPSGPGNTLVCVSTGLNNNVTVSVQGAPDLKPQESENFSVGFIFQTERFRGSIDYWNFNYTDLIAQSQGAQSIVSQDCEPPPVNDGIPNDPRVIRDAGGQLRQVNTTFTNIGAVETDGVDISADYNMDIGNSTLLLDASATYVNKFDVDSNGDGVLNFDGAGSRNFNNGFKTMPEYRANLGATYLMGNHSFNVTGRYIDGYANDQTGDAPVSSWTTFDAQYSIMLPGMIGEGDTTLTVGVNNLTDEDPPALNRGVPRIDPVTGIYNRGWIDRPGYDSTSGHDLRGRIVYVNFKHLF